MTDCGCAATCNSLPESQRAKPIVTVRSWPSLSSPAGLAKRVAAAFHTTVEAMATHDRQRAPASARHVYWWLARSIWGTSYPDLGRLMRGPVEFDHTTTIHGVRKVECEVDKEARYRAGVRDSGSHIGTAALALLLEIETAQQRANGATSGPRSSSESKERRGQL